MKLSHMLVAVLLGLCGLIEFGMESPLWLQPSLVGIFWGATLVAGYSLFATGGSQVPGIVLAVGVAWLMNHACFRVTNLAAGECLLLTTLLFASGWIKRRYFCDPLETRGGQFGLMGGQWSIADVATLTALIACLVQAFSQITLTPLLMSIAWAFLAGLLYSWIAYRWVWLDRWSSSSIAVGAVGIMVIVTYIDLVAPADRTWWECFVWLCMGPVNVVAGQATTVLLFFAVLRYEADSRDCISR
jgi:hypothetical protein